MHEIFLVAKFDVMDKRPLKCSKVCKTIKMHEMRDDNQDFMYLFLLFILQNYKL